jgi:hypothetical protein
MAAFPIGVTGEEELAGRPESRRLVPEHAKRFAEKLDESGFGA